MTKRIIAVLLAAALTLSVPALAADGFTDVPVGAWYADAVRYVREHGLMSGTGPDTFSPNLPVSRAMLVTVLWRQAGAPSPSASSGFRDTAADAWYAAGLSWAVEHGIIAGYGDGSFGPDDPVSREQLAVILWRAAGSPTAAGYASYADRNRISDWASDAVVWAGEAGLLAGRDGNIFDPGGTASRAEAAAILQRSAESPGPAPGTEGEPKVLVAYFSCTGTTRSAAEMIQAATGGDLFEIVPAQPYTGADLNYSSDCRANREQNDDGARPAIASNSRVERMGDYDVVFLGYPIWWGIPPKIMRTFLESYDWSGKIIVPFCTSGGSGFNSEGLNELAPDATWAAGRRLNGATRETIVEWVEGLHLGIKEETSMKVTVKSGDTTVVFELNNSPAAQSLAAQLPLTIEVQPFSANEQTFYPPVALDTAGTPAITGARAGTLAYYAPWGDVVMFYEDFSGGSGGLYELGRAVEGADAIRSLSGTITVTAA